MRPTGDAEIPRPLLWALLLVALARYTVEHWGLLKAPIPDTPHWPHFALTPPGGGAAPFVLLFAAFLGGMGVARRFPLQPRLVGWGLGGATTLIVPAHVLGFAGLVTGRGLFTPWAWAISALIVAIWALRGSKTPKASLMEADVEATGRDPLLPWLALVMLLLGVLLAHSVLRTVRIGPRCWDGESYHLPVPLGWLGISSLTEVIVRLKAAGKHIPWHFAHPGNGHLLMCVPLLLQWDLMAYLIQLPFLLLSFWSCRTLSRAAGASRGAATLSALAFVSAPLVVEQASVPMLDLATASFSLAALALLFRIAEQGSASTGDLKLAGLSAGLAIGTKTTALAHLGLLGVVLATSRWVFMPPYRARLSQAGVLAAMLLVPSGFWYLRSTVLLGNPIYPIRLGIEGHAIVGGVTAEDMSGDWERSWMGIKSRWEWLALPFRDPVYFSEGGFGALLVALGVLGLVGGGVALLKDLVHLRMTPLGRLAILAAAGLLIFFLAAARTPRFNLPLFAIVAALAGPVVDAFGQGWRRHALGFLSASAVALTLVLMIHMEGWDLSSPTSRAERLQGDIPAVPVALDQMPPLVVFNDTHDDDGARPSNYWLFGADHRHLVLEDPTLSADDPAEFLARLRTLGATSVFLRIRKGMEEPARYRTAGLVPLARYDGNDYRSVIYRIR